MLKKEKLTPSGVQTQLVHGVGNAESPTGTVLPAIWQPCSLASLQRFKSIDGKDWQGRRGFL